MAVEAQSAYERFMAKLKNGHFDSVDWAGGGSDGGLDDRPGIQTDDHPMAIGHNGPLILLGIYL